MKIAIDVSPLTSGHKVRGVGFYLKYLKDSLVRYHPSNEYIFFTQRSEIEYPVDVIHYPYFDPFFLTLPLRKRAKTIVTVHDLTPLVFPRAFPSGIKGKIRWLIQRQALRSADAVIADSEASKKDILHFTGLPDEKVHVVYLAAGEEFTEAGKKAAKNDIIKKYQLPEKFALYVGDVTWNKNLPRLVEAALKADIPLVMAGKALSEKGFDAANPWNADRVQLEKLINGEKSIFRLGFIPTDDLVGLYKSAQVFVMPSLYEGFGLPILEAMSCGCPVITTKEGSLPEVAGDAAYYVDAYSVESISKGIEAVFKNQRLQKELQSKGFEQAKKFMWKKTALETIHIYES